jgi:hypothetical protein
LISNVKNIAVYDELLAGTLCKKTVKRLVAFYKEWYSYFMTAWNVLNEIIKILPSFAAAVLLIGAGIIFIIGFSRHGVNFVKYGFKQTAINDIIEKLATKEDINRIEAKVSGLDLRMGGLEDKVSSLDLRMSGLEDKVSGLDFRMSGLEDKIEAIETNHFSHLKDFLTELTSILLDKGVMSLPAASGGVSCKRCLIDEARSVRKFIIPSGLIPNFCRRCLI